MAFFCSSFFSNAWLLVVLVPIVHVYPEVAYPGVNNVSIATVVLSYIFQILSLIPELGGWCRMTFYPMLALLFGKPIFELTSVGTEPKKECDPPGQGR